MIKEELLFDNDCESWIAETKIPRYDYIKSQVLEIVKSYNSEESNVLEIGCGLSSYLPSLKGNLFGIDISNRLLEMNKCDATFIKCDARECSKLNIKFDIIFMVGVMHHIPCSDYNSTLDEFKKILKKDGILLIVEPNMLSITGVYYIFRKIFEYIFSRKSLIKMIGFYSDNEKYILPSFKYKLIERFFLIKKYSICTIRIPPFNIFKKINIESINKFIDKRFQRFNNVGTTVIFICKNKEDSK